MKNSQSKLIQIKAMMIAPVATIVAIMVLFTSAANASGSHYASSHEKSSHKTYGHKSYDHKESRLGTFRKCNKTTKCDKTLSVPLFAGDYKRVGVAKVELDGNDLKVTYEMKKEWRIKETHLDVADYYKDLPLKADGTPDVEALAYKTKHFTPVKSASITLNASQWPLGTELFIAAQATVVKNSKNNHKQYTAKSRKGSYGHKSNKKARKYGRKYSHNYDRDSSDKHDHDYDGKHYDDSSHDYHDDKQNKMHGKSAWAKGMKFPGQKHASYFTYTLETCDPVELGTIQFTDAIYTTKEGDPEVVITVSRSGNLERAATVEFTTVDVSANNAAINGMDYILISGELLFPAGQNSAQFSVTPVDDSDVESLEIFDLELSNPVGANLGLQSTATVEIEDNDVAPSATVEFIQAEFEAFERPNLATITVRVVRSGCNPCTTIVEVDYATADGTASEADRDYRGATGTLVFFPGGDDTLTFKVQILPDRVVDPDETVLLQLFNEIGAELGTQSKATLIIREIQS